MGGIDFSAVGLLVGAVGGVFSFWIGRKLRRKRLDKRRDRDRAATLAGESRQARRARERREQGR